MPQKDNVVIHVGPPKTGSTTIQSAIIPNLGRPYAIKTTWTMSLATGRATAVPALPPDAIISDERLGQFRDIPPSAMAHTLAEVFAGATVIHVRRNPLDLFNSFYRQALTNNIALAMKPKPERTLIYPPTADGFFDASVAQYKNRGCGLFAMLNNREVAEAFQSRFDFHTLSFDILAHEPRRFVQEFASLCGCDLEIDLPQENISSNDAYEAMLASADSIPADIVAIYREYYESSYLSLNRQERLQLLG